MKRLLVFLAVMVAAGAAWSSPRVSGPNAPRSPSTWTVTFVAGDTSDSEAIPVSGFCTVRYQQSSGDDASLYAVTTADTAATSGTLISAFTASTTTAITFTAGTRWVKAVATDATAGGSVMTIDCAPATGAGGADGWTDAGDGIVADANHRVIVPGSSGDADDVCEANEICLEDGILTAEGFVARDQASGSNFHEFDDNPTTLPSAPSGANVRLYTAADGELRKKDASDPSTGLALVTMDNLIDEMRKRPLWFTDFMNSTTSNGTVDAALDGWDYLPIASGALTRTNSDADHPGIVILTPAASDGSGVNIRQHIQSMLVGGGEVFEIAFQIKRADMTTGQFQFGFMDIAASGTPTDGATINFQAALTPTCRTYSNATGSDSASIATLSVDTWYRARISVNSDATSVTCQIWTADGTSQGSQSMTTNIPTGAGRVLGSGLNATNSGGTLTTDLVWVDYIATGYLGGRALAR